LEIEKYKTNKRKDKQASQQVMNHQPLYRTELRRVFLVAGLPAPATRADAHLQFFDNYIRDTRLRLRSIRSPQTRAWTWILEQRFPSDENDLSRWQVAEIHLDEAEHAAFEIFEGREIRKNERVETNELRFNRYFYDFNGKQIEIDLFLNPLWGYNPAKVFFDSEAEMKNFAPPDFAVAEITQNEFFIGRNLLGKTLADVRDALAAKEN
jgi:CYTH domain-containing protein